MQQFLQDLRRRDEAVAPPERFGDEGSCLVAQRMPSAPKSQRRITSPGRAGACTGSRLTRVICSNA